MTANKVFTYQKKTFLLIAISTVVRLIIASTLELSNPEAYYWAYSLKLQWNYFDHPPMVAWLIRLTTANLKFHNELFVRIGAIIASAICTWLIFKIGTFINDVKTGWFSALLYTSSLYGSIAAGIFILPDSPQMVFWFSGIFVLLKILHSGSGNRKSYLLWCLFGIMSGLCIMSKVHGIFLWFGVALYVLIIDRSWLKGPGIYLSAIITLIIISPIIIWNLQNNFISYKFQISRITLIGAGIHITGFCKELLAVISLTNPVSFFLIYSNIMWVFKRATTVGKKDIQLLLFCGLPLIAVLLFISLFRETLPHWPGPAYSCLLIIPAIKLSSIIERKRRNIPNVIKVALAFVVMVVITDVFVTNYYPGTTSDQRQWYNLGKGDISLDMYGWNEAGKKFDSLFKGDVEKGIMPKYAPIIITKWFPAAHIDFYIANKTKQETFGMGNILDLDQYYWMNEYKKQLKIGDSAYYIVPSNLFNYVTFDEVINNFMDYEMPLVISQFRSGIICKKIYIFRLRGYRNYKSLKKREMTF